MILTLLALLMTPPPTPQEKANLDSFLNERIGDHTNERTPLDDLTLGQMMTLASLSPLRINEARCAGRALANGVDAAGAERIQAAVAAALVVEGSVTLKQARNFVGMYAQEEADEGEARMCAGLYRSAREGAPAVLPAVDPALVDPRAVSCFGQYRAAAVLAKGDEREGLLRDAERARVLALAGRDAATHGRIGALLDASEKALTAIGFGVSEQDMMRLVGCQPFLRGFAPEAESAGEAE